MPMSSREVIRLLRQDGWEHVGTSGDHWHFKHASKPGKTTVQHPRKDIPAKTLRAIERQSGVHLLRKG
jgi:predicted RNA binding protein YcfA (HicA-like mRNA interferase family)